MDIVLVNSDLITSDTSSDLAKCIVAHDLLVCSYHEVSGDVPQQLGDQISLGKAKQFAIGDVNSIVAVAPGPFTLKFIRGLMTNDLVKRTPSLPIGLHLPEFWIIQKLRTVDQFSFEVFNNYIFACLSADYPYLSMASVSEACSEYYSRTMFGGFRPRAVRLMDIFQEFGVARPVPLGIG